MIENGRRPSCIRLYPKAMIILIFVLIVIFCAPQIQAEERATFGVVVGCSRILRAEDVVRAAVANPNIADIVVVSKTEVIVNGKAEGRTTLYIWDSSGRVGYDIRVCDDNQEFLSEIRNTIGLDDLKLRFAKSTLLMEGTCANDVEYDRADKIAKAYAEKVLNLITVLHPKSPPPEPTIEASQIEDEMGIEGVHVRVVKGAIILEGSVKEPGDSKRAEEFAKLFAPQVLNFVDVEAPPEEEVKEAAGEGGVVAEVAPPEEAVEKVDVEDTGDEAEVLPPINTDAELRDRIIAALQDPAIEVMVVDGTALLEGEVPDDYRKLRAEAVAKLYAGKVVSVLRVAKAEPELPVVPVMPEKPAPVVPEITLEEKVGAYINIPTVNVRSIDGKLLLEGSVESQNDLERVQRIAELFSNNVVSLLDVANPVQVLLQVQVVEINSGALKNLGITWGSIVDNAFSPGSFMFGEWTSPVGSKDNISPEDAWPFGLSTSNIISELWRLSPIRALLETLVSEDLAKILAAPSLLTLSGQEADFLVGGEIPVYLGQADGKVVFEWRPYGIKLDMLPTVDTRGRVVLDIRPEVSSLDWNNALDIGLATIPALRTRRASTHLIVEDGVTIAIGGLIHTTEAKIVKKLPILGDIPIIGGLFRSEKFERGESELIILITPRIVCIGETIFWDRMVPHDALRAFEIEVKTLGK